VVGIDAASRHVIVGEKPHLAVSNCMVGSVNWMIAAPDQPIDAACRIRYRHHEVPSRITTQGDGLVKVVFNEPQSGVTPGQAAVFYDGDRVLGGGWIVESGTRDA
jgi:tRNA-specific 2-thiouridylase